MWRGAAEPRQRHLFCFRSGSRHCYQPAGIRGHCQVPSVLPGQLPRHLLHWCRCHVVVSHSNAPCCQGGPIRPGPLGGRRERREPLQTPHWCLLAHEHSGAAADPGILPHQRSLRPVPVLFHRLLRKGCLRRRPDCAVVFRGVPGLRARRADGKPWICTDAVHYDGVHAFHSNADQTVRHEACVLLWALHWCCCVHSSDNPCPPLAWSDGDSLLLRGHHQRHHQYYPLRADGRHGARQ
mmetsp:Transcript_266/g.941  ORF Transcript_266/g.941 Transcript_266/m.941 type:complete len:238 (+) Transcript_266:381-1094(+)